MPRGTTFKKVVSDADGRTTFIACTSTGVERKGSIDTEDVEKIMDEQGNSKGWCLMQQGSQYRLSKMVYDKEGNRKHYPLGKYLLGIDPWDMTWEIDHVNREGMDYEKKHLSKETRSGNMKNRGNWKVNKELPKYVYVHRLANGVTRYGVKIYHDGSCHYEGVFDTPQEAEAHRDMLLASKYSN